MQAKVTIMGPKLEIVAIYVNPDIIKISRGSHWAPGADARKKGYITKQSIASLMSGTVVHRASHITPNKASASDCPPHTSRDTKQSCKTLPPQTDPSKGHPAPRRLHLKVFMQAKVTMMGPELEIVAIYQLELNVYAQEGVEAKAVEAAYS
ncbi:hypothetical protein JKP88DRAFT_348008 [Tribonema minus]|uniref:Uncharacterized protein n=1 Tax=Tribonema minus TaxID=303371 RepID=A0A835Z453_9STRA|nr:hypothetical protein JKP88DRAFT_348008 [Tribonema minus]